MRHQPLYYHRRQRLHRQLYVQLSRELRDQLDWPLRMSILTQLDSLRDQLYWEAFWRISEHVRCDG